MAMKTSPHGVTLIMDREGVRLTAYQDTVGVWTIGVGHTGRMSKPSVRPDMTITLAQALDYLAADLWPVEKAVNSAIKVPMTQNQFDAMVSLAFNIGAGGFTGSTVVHKFNAHDPKGAADAFLMWEHPPELRKRREAERAQFLTSNVPQSDVG